MAEIIRSTRALRPLSEVLEEAKSRIIILAIDAGIVSTRWVVDFKKALDRGVKAQFLLTDQESLGWTRDAFRMAWPQIDRFPVLKDTLASLAGISSPNLSVAFHDLMPLYSMVLVDDSWMQVSNYLYGTFDWVSLTFDRESEPSLFAKYLGSLRLAERHITREFSP